MATAEARLIALAQAVGADIKALRQSDGTLSGLNTAAKTNLVAAINEVLSVAQAAGGGAAINDTTASGTATYSSNKISSDLAAAINSLRTELRAGAGAALDTFNELAVALGNDPNFAATIAAGLGNRVRVDAVQTLTVPQKLQARQNIDAYGSVELGNPDADLVASYTAAKA